MEEEKDSQLDENKISLIAGVQKGFDDNNDNCDLDLNPILHHYNLEEDDVFMQNSNHEYSDVGQPITSIKYKDDCTDEHDKNNENNDNTILFDNLLFEIYDKWSYKYRQDSSWDSDTLTSASDAVAAAMGIMVSCGNHRSRAPSSGPENSTEHVTNRESPVLWQDLTENYLYSKTMSDLIRIRDQLKHKVSIYNQLLVRQLKRRDRGYSKLQKNCDILTAILQASSLKRREDTKLKFVMEPKPGIEAFEQWCDAMKGVARLPLGLPSEIRKKVWLSLANHHISVQKYDWNRVIKFAFNEKSNPDDDALGLQIVKDLHRTGCDTFTTESERAILKRVLLAYARWNKRVGYCQGFNVLAAIILEVMERNEEDSLKVMVYLVDHILPESYFAQNLQALSIDMAVFRELLGIHAPKLATHINHLQTMSQKQNCYGNSDHYEPPLTNVFTMQWFLTLFATCLPPELVLRIWDSIMLEGSEIILRTGIVIWDFLSDRLLKVSDADSFYCVMRDLTNELADGELVKPEQLVNEIYNLGPMPLPSLSALRDRFTYNINPFSSSMPSATVSYGAGNDSGEEDEYELEYDYFDEDADIGAGMKKKSTNNKKQKPHRNGRNSKPSSKLGCFSGIVPHKTSLGNANNSGGGGGDGGRGIKKSPRNEDNDDSIGRMDGGGNMPHSLSSVDISQVGPGAIFLDKSSKAGNSNSKDPSQTVGNLSPHGGNSNTPSHNAPRMSTDLPALESQYRRIRARQKHTTLRIGNFAPSSTTTATSGGSSRRRQSQAKVTATLGRHNSLNTASVGTTIVVGSAYPPPQTCMVNHLFLPHSNSKSSQSNQNTHKPSRPSLIRQPRVSNNSMSSNTTFNQINVPMPLSPGTPALSSSRDSNQVEGRRRGRYRHRSLSQSEITTTCDDEDDDGAKGDVDTYSYKGVRQASSLSDITSLFSISVRGAAGRAANDSDDDNGYRMTLLQLCTDAHNRQITETNAKLTSLSNQNSLKPNQIQSQAEVETETQGTQILSNLVDSSPTSILPTPDLNSILERHHKRIQNNIGPISYSKSKPSKSSPKKQIQHEPLLSLDEDQTLNTIDGKAAQWVAQHHTTNPLASLIPNNSNNNSNIDPTRKSIHRHNSVTSNISSVTSFYTGPPPTRYNATFGSKNGLYNTMAQSRLKRNKQNGGILQSAYEQSNHRIVEKRSTPIHQQRVS